MTSRRRTKEKRAPVDGDLSFKDRQDGPSPDDTGRIGRSRTSHSRPRTTSDARFATWLFSCRKIHEFARKVEPGHEVGCPLTYNPVIPVVIEMLTGCHGSQRKVVLTHTDPILWQHYRAETRRAFPLEPHMWLDEDPPSRSQIRYWLDTRLSDDESLALYEQLLEDIGIEVSRTIGIGRRHRGDLTHPTLDQVLGGDATYLRAAFRTSFEEAVDKTTGEFRTLRFDPDAKKIQQDKGNPGYRMTHVAAHTGHTREDIVYRIDISPGQHGNDATIYMDMALKVHERLPGMRVTVYDGAMYPTEIDRALSAGLIPMNHVQLTRNGTVARFNIGAHEFVTRNGATHTAVVTFVDGPPCVTIATAEGRHEVRLVRGQTKPRRNADGTFTMYGYAEYPDEPIVPAPLRGAKTLIRYSSTPEEIAAGRRRTRAGRMIPAGDPDFPRNYGGRNNTENRHHQLKLNLPNKRLNVCGITRVRRRMISRFIAKNLDAALAWHERTGGDIRHLFAQPPPGPEHAA